MNIRAALEAFRNRTTENRELPQKAAEPEKQDTSQADPSHNQASGIRKFCSDNLIVEIESRLLEDSFYLVSNKQCLQHLPGGVVSYLPEELEFISNLSPDTLRQIHQIKKKLGAQVVGRERKSARN